MLQSDSTLNGEKAVKLPMRIAIGIIAWNEEAGLAATLNSLFEQSLFRELKQRGGVCEITCVANGCTDQTVSVAARVFETQAREHPYSSAFTTRVADLAERGKVNAWNQFVHVLSAPEAQFLFLMDADILIHRADTIWKMVLALEQDAEASVAVDRPCKHLLFKKDPSLRDRLSLAVSRLTHASEAQLCGQLYGIRSAIARNIYLPKDLAACEDGFIKALVCTDFLTRPVTPARIRLVEGAEHTFEAYTSPAALLRNQKRQIIGQTIVHILVDEYLKGRPLAERRRMAATLREQEQKDPAWLKRLIAGHLERTRFWWRLYPGMVSRRFKRLGKTGKRFPLAGLIAATASGGLEFFSGAMAYSSLKAGCTTYWPQAQRPELARLGSGLMRPSGAPGHASTSP